MSRNIQSLLGRVLALPNLPRDVYEKIMEELDERKYDVPAPPSCAKCNELAKLLVECRDALPAISITSARLHNVSLSLATRIEAALKPWEVIEEENPAPPKFADVSCSQCGRSFGPGNEGFSHCIDHIARKGVPR